MGLSDRGWVFVVGRMYPPGNVNGKFLVNVPSWSYQMKEPAGQQNGQADKFFTYSGKSDSEGSVSYESTDSGGYRGTFKSSSYVLRDDPEPKKQPVRKETTEEKMEIKYCSLLIFIHLLKKKLKKSYKYVGCYYGRC